jgi:hypothetical protein
LEKLAQNHGRCGDHDRRGSHYDSPIDCLLQRPGLRAAAGSKHVLRAFSQSFRNPSSTHSVSGA